MASPIVEENSKNVAAGAAAKSNPLRELEAQGQAVWLDYIRRNLLTSGELKRLRDQDGLSGLTSNPTIFEKAIGGSSDYDDAIRQLLSKDARMATTALFEALAIEDIRAAADVLRPVYDRTKGADGFVSLEVSPDLAHNTQETIRQAQRLWKTVARPNLMIKVPATPEGLPAIEQLLSEGINVNITLMFSLQHYEDVAQAYIRGLTKAAHPEGIASVASFFVSRVDTMLDPILEKKGVPEALALRGKIAIANSRVVYQRFEEIFFGSAFEPLRKKGAKVQRVLWASTSTKNPAYRDTLYAEELIGPHTVDTMPPATVDAFRDHGQVHGKTIARDLNQARLDIAALKNVGIDLGEITARLQTEGVASFKKSFEDLLATLEVKRQKLLATKLDSESPTLGALQSAVEKRLADWQQAGFNRRLWARDPTLWAKPGTPEITNRLGWLHLPEIKAEQLHGLMDFGRKLHAEGFTHAVVLGMGGSSLAPEVFASTFGHPSGYPKLHVLDSTHPEAVRNIEASVDLAHTLFIVSSKSGATLEPNSFFFYFWKLVSAQSKKPGAQFVAITDPGTSLQKLGEQRGFRQVFLANSEVGGRYSALTHFGLVPAAVAGVDLDRLVNRAWTMQEACASSVPENQSPGLELGAILGEAALAGRNKVTLVASRSIRQFPSWLEQLIAESTGKLGKGIVPVAGEVPLAPVDAYGGDRIFVHLKLESDADSESENQLKALEQAGHPVVRIVLKELADLGQEFFRWEVAIAAAGAVLVINPFDQPDVQFAKDLARQAMQNAGQGRGTSDDGPRPVDAGDRNSLRVAISQWLGTAHPADYIAINAFIAPTPAADAALHKLRLALRDRTRLATMLGYGPRFLHSTGQLHKGGPNTGLFLEIIDQPASDEAVPETDYTFGQVVRAQAQGDFGALLQRGRRAIRVDLGRDPNGGLERILEVARA